MTEPQLSITQAGTHFTPRAHYLNTASIGVPPRACVEAVQESIERWSRAELAAPDFDPFVAAARRSFARLLGVSEDHVAIGATVSEFVGVVANSLPVGAEIVCA